MEALKAWVVQEEICCTVDIGVPVEIFRVQHVVDAALRRLALLDQEASDI